MLFELYIYKKEVDWSILHEGFTVPVNRQDVFYANINLDRNHGTRKDIKLLIEGRKFEAKFINQNFDRRKYLTLWMRETERSFDSKKSLKFRDYNSLML